MPSQKELIKKKLVIEKQFDTLAEYESYFQYLIGLTFHSKKKEKLKKKLIITKWVINIKDDLIVIFKVDDVVEYLEKCLSRC